MAQRQEETMEAYVARLLQDLQSARNEANGLKEALEKEVLTHSAQIERYEQENRTLERTVRSLENRNS